VAANPLPERNNVSKWASFSGHTNESASSCRRLGWGRAVLGRRSSPTLDADRITNRIADQLADHHANDSADRHANHLANHLADQLNNHLNHFSEK